MMYQHILNARISTPEQEKSSPAGKRAARNILILGTTPKISKENEERICQILKLPVDWEYLINLAELHGVAPLIAHALLTSGISNQIPKLYLERLNKIYHNALYRNVILSEELTKVLFSFNRRDIPVMVLKGTILAEQLYGNPALRVVTDMDILVEHEKMSLANSTLIEIGYRLLPLEEEWDHPFHEAPYFKNVQFPFFIELHRNLDDPRLVPIPQQEIWRRAKRLQIQEATALVLSPEDYLIYLSNNLSRPSGQTLKYLCDIAHLLKKYEGKLDWKYIIESACSWQMATAVYYPLKRTHDLLGVPVPAHVLEKLKTGTIRLGLMNLLVSRNSFISPIANNRLKNETLTLFRSLLMKHPRQAMIVLSRYRGIEKRWAWLSTFGWAILVFFIALVRNISWFIREGHNVAKSL